MSTKPTFFAGAHSLLVDAATVAADVLLADAPLAPLELLELELLEPQPATAATAPMSASARINREIFIRSPPTLL
jgi:hypothetical protein